MSIEETRLDLAVRMADRALRSQGDGDVEARLRAFAVAYAGVRALGVEDDDWGAETLKAAWALVQDHFAKGGAPEAVAAALTRAHGAIVELAEPPPGKRRSKPRRDA